MVVHNKVTYHNYKNYYNSGHMYKSNKIIQYHISPESDTTNINMSNIKFNKPGFHEIIYNNNIKEYVAVNIDSLEHYDKIINNIDLETLFTNVYIIDDIENLNSILKSVIIGYQLWRPILYFLILLILIEMLISNNYFIKNE